MTAFRLLLHALSPMHPGGGESESGIEQAITRDRATGRPLLPATSLKGVLRDAARYPTGTRASLDALLLKETFGPDTQQAHEHRGAVAFGDANLLVFPARSVVGTFAWTTSPDVLRSWSALHRGIGGLTDIGIAVPEPSSAGAALVASRNSIVQTTHNGQSMVYLEDLDLTCGYDADVERWAGYFASLVFPGAAWTSWRDLFARRFCLVHDDVFSFLCEYATQLDPHVALDSDKRVKNFWHEESLPSETILGSVSVIDPLPGMTADAGAIASGLQSVCRNTLQFGGHETVGRGIARVLLDGTLFPPPPEAAA